MNEAIGQLLDSLEAIRYEIARLRQKLEAIALGGSYEELGAVAERIIIVEVRAHDEGVYEEVREELYQLKRLLASISTVYRIALTAQQRKPRKRARWLQP